MKSIGWGLVGTGGHADRFMAPAINSLKDSGRLVSVVSRDSVRAQEFGARHGGARGLTRFGDLLDDPDVDVVLITTPNALHADQVVAAANAGKHVLCDKPLALNETSAQQAVDACERAGVKLGIVFQTRFTAPALRCREVIESGALGQTQLVNAEHSSGRGDWQGWRNDATMAGRGAIFNLGVHTYDLVRYIIGDEVEEVCALFDTRRTGELERQALALLRFRGGAMAYIGVNHTFAYPQNDLTIHGDRGRLVGKNMTRHMQDCELLIVSDGIDERVPLNTHDAYRRVVEDMVAAINENRSPHATGVDGLRSVQLTDALVRSALEGRVVELPA